MNFRQWDIWKARPAGFETDHWFVLLSNPERLNFDPAHQINGLARFTAIDLSSITPGSHWRGLGDTWFGWVNG